MIVTQAASEQANYVGNKTIAGTLTVTSTLTIGTTAILQADAANILALRNGANAQAFKVYKTFTDASNYARVALYSDGSDFYLDTQGAGTGANPGQLLIRAAGANSLRLGTNGALRWQINSAGAFISEANFDLKVGISALATTATVGFLMVNSCAGPPTGVPGAIPTGQIPLVWDSTNLQLYAYTGGAWKKSAAFT